MSDKKKTTHEVVVPSSAKKPYPHDPRNVRNLPQASYVAEKLPDEVQPKYSTVIVAPTTSTNTMVTRFRVLSAGPGTLYMNYGKPEEVEPRAKVDDIVVAFEHGAVALPHLGKRVYLIMEMNVIYVEPRVENNESSS